MSLPNLLFVGDVPVESTYHGSALLFRLFENYPASRLRIIEGVGYQSLPERRLPEVHYEQLPIPGKRYLNTRFHSYMSTALSVTAAQRSRILPSLLKGFEPAVVCTVGHGYSWMTAAAYARQYKLPLHFIIHDDWPRAARIVSPARKWLNDRFGQVYRQSVTRMCVSPFMVQKYASSYGVKGEVLYPSRASDVAVVSQPPIRAARDNQQLVYAFGGTINSPGYSQALKELSEALEPQGGQLNIYGPITQSEAEDVGLSRSNIHLRGLLPSNQLIQELRDNVDVLFLPVSFADSDRENMSLSFPSKLTDYTVCGVPILIYGPQYSSAVRWAQDNENVAEVVLEQTPRALSMGLTRLQNSQYRRQLGASALQVGDTYFSHAAAQELFFRNITQSVINTGAAAP